jgi:hypothetical protein
VEKPYEGVMAMMLRKEGYYRTFPVDADVIPSTVKPKADAVDIYLERPWPCRGFSFLSGIPTMKVPPPVLNEVSGGTSENTPIAA